MKKNPFSVTARITIGTLFLIISVSLIVLALNVNALGQRASREAKKQQPKSKLAPTGIFRPAAKPASPQGAVVSPAGILFSHNTIVDFSATSGEPFINAAPIAVAPNTPIGSPFISVPFGLSTTVSILWKSADGGRTFIPLGTPIVRDSAPGPGGGDSHQDFDAVGRLYFVDLGGGCVTAAVSDDGGNTFLKVNPLICAGPTNPLGLTDDRQWAGAFGDGIGYMTVRNLAVSVGNNFHLNRTRDAGVTWNGAQQIGTVSQSGALVMDRTKRNIAGTDYILGYQMYYSGGTLKMLRIQDPDTGAPVTVVDLTVGTPGGDVANVFPIAAVDNAGNLYVTWSNETAIFLATSTDRGATWTGAKRVSPLIGPAGEGTIIMPWAIAGDPGRIDVVWYRGSLPGNSTNNNNRWDIYMAQSLNALAASPTWAYTKVNEHTIHFGEICLSGLTCDLSGGANDRSFLEFPSITIDHRGAAMITWNDNTNQSAVTAVNPQVTGAPYVMFGKQICGPSLFASIGDVGEGGTVAITSPANGAVLNPGSPVTVAGIHTLPPGTFDKDEAGDARFPDHGAVIGSNIPALDIRQVDMTETATHIDVHMQVADLTLPALAAAPGLSGGDGVLYLVQWDYDQSEADPLDRVFWVAAEVRGGAPVGRTGTLGVIRSATSKKFITYNPVLDDSMQVAVTMPNTAPGTITLSIPKSLVGNPPSGARLKTVTGYAMSERGALTPCPDNTQAACENVFTPTSLPIQVDASGAFTYVMGGGLQLGGVVELSIDDPSFSNPTPASANTNGTWEYMFAAPGAGQYTVYARQIVRDCATSPTASAVFTIPGSPIPATAVSLKTHAPGGDFPIELPLIGDPGIECRKNTAADTGPNAGRDHRVVVTFVDPVTVGNVTVTSREGMPTATFSVNGAEVTVDLHDVPDEQRMTVNLLGVNDGGGPVNVFVPVDFLEGDTNADDRVNVGDTNETKSRSGQITDNDNKRSDVNLDGRINVGDTNFVKSHSGNAITP